MSAFSATCRRIEAPDVRIKDRRTLTAHDVVREDLSETSPYQRNFTHNVCDESFTDRDTYLAHMRECHGLSLGPMARVSTRKPRAPKAPAQKTYDPAPLDPGAWVRWTDGGQERTGQVWSAGPYAHSVWVVPTDPEEGKPAVELRRSSLKSLGHAVPVGLFGDDDASDDAPTGARIEPGPGRVFTDAAAVREHWVAGGDGPANENVRESDRERLRVLALTPARDLVLSGGLVAVKRTSAPAGWDILHAGTGRGLGRGPLRTKRDAVQALTLLAMLPVAWQDTADIAAGAVNHAPRVNGESVLTAQMGLIFAGQATEDSIREAVGKMAPTVEDESPTVEDESAPDYGVTVDGTMVATVRRVSIDTPSEPATVEASDPGPVESGPDDAATDAHSATLEPDATYPHLVRWHCACGVSGVGWTRPSIAGSMHARHVATVAPDAAAVVAPVAGPTVAAVPDTPMPAVAPASVASAPAPGPSSGWTIVGYDRDQHECAQCGCEHRKGTVTMVGPDGAAAMGLACASRVTGIGTVELRMLATRAARASATVAA